MMRMVEDKNVPLLMTVASVPIATLGWMNTVDAVTKIVTMFISLCVLVWWLRKLYKEMKKGSK